MESSDQVKWMVIGAQKSGTTALFDHIVQHPDVCPSKVKEIHFFDKNYGKGLDWYHDMFEDQPGLRGEATPRYMHDRRAAPRIHEYNPDMRMIASLRNPADRSRSAWGMHKRGVKEREYRDYWRSSAWRRNIGKYYNHLSRFFELFDREQILIFDFDDFSDNRERIIRDCWDHIGVDPSHAVPTEYRRNHRDYQPLSHGEREMLANFYYDDVCRLEDMLGWDLTHWKPMGCRREITNDFKPLHITEILND